MKTNLIGLAAIAITVTCPAVAAVTLKCDADTHCDGHMQNCSQEPYSLVVTVDPKSQTVIVGNATIPANFKNTAAVVFEISGYHVVINRFEYSIILGTSTEVRHGNCVKVQPAW